MARVSLDERLQRFERGLGPGFGETKNLETYPAKHSGEAVKPIEKH